MDQELASPSYSRWGESLKGKGKKVLIDTADSM